MNPDFNQEYQNYCHQIEEHLHQYVRTLTPHAKLEQAIAYSLLAKGKRIRPVLTLATCKMLGGTEKEAIPFAAALEMVHTYSLIHDDLPAMDDDDLRRGKPTCHKQFDQATAILAGDALLSASFQQIALAPVNPQKIAAATLCLSALSGTQGMVGGQALDLGTTPTTVEELEQLQMLKTGALLIAACQLGAIAAGAEVEQITQITNYASYLGRAFQIQDDILDAIGDRATLGKSPGSDQKAGKHTFYTLFGPEKAKAEVEKLTQQAKESIQNLEGAEFLLWLVEDLQQRKK